MPQTNSRHLALEAIEHVFGSDGSGPYNVPISVEQSHPQPLGYGVPIPANQVDTRSLGYGIPILADQADPPSLGYSDPNTILDEPQDNNAPVSLGYGDLSAVRLDPQVNNGYVPANDPQQSRPNTVTSANGVDLSTCKIGKVIKSGENGTASFLNGAPDTPSFVFKTAKNATTQAELEREADFYARAGDHPNIAKCYGMAEIEGKRGLVLECINGDDMAKTMDKMAAVYKAGTISHEEYFGVLQYATNQMLSAMERLAEVGIVHNDIRPDNIMFDAKTGDVKLIDFGVAVNQGEDRTSLKAPVGFGTVAPEFVVAKSDHNADPTKPNPGQVLGGKHDIFSVGATTYRVVEGQDFQYNNDLDDPNRKFADFREANSANESYGRSQVPEKASGIALHKGQGKAAQPNATTNPTAPLNVLPGYYAGGDGDATNPVSGDAQDGGYDDEGIIDLLRTNAASSQANVPVRPAYSEDDDGNRTKIPGRFGTETDYTRFVNQLMHPDPSKRLSLQEARKQQFLADPLLDDDQARRVLQKFMNAPPANSNGSASPNNGPPKAPRNTPTGYLGDADPDFLRTGTAPANASSKDPKPDAKSNPPPQVSSAADQGLDSNWLQEQAAAKLAAERLHRFTATMGWRIDQLIKAGRTPQEIHAILHKEEGVAHEDLEKLGFPA